MIAAARAFATPWGGSVRLEIQADEDTSALTLATAEATAPDPTDYGGARVVHTGPLLQGAGNWAEVAPWPTDTPWWIVLDLITASLPDGQKVYYHVYEELDDGYGDPTTVSATPNCFRDTELTLARDIVKPRLEYHLSRAIAKDVVHVTSGAIAVQEREVLDEGLPLPVVLVKERAAPSGRSESVGSHYGSYVDAVSGKAYREYRRQIRSTVEILVVADNPDQRTTLERYLYGAMVQDLPYYSAAGLAEIAVSKQIRHEVAEGWNAYMAEFSFECEGQVVTTEEQDITLTLAQGVTGTMKAG